MRCFTTNKSFDFGADSLRITIRIHVFNGIFTTAKLQKLQNYAVFNHENLAVETLMEMA